MKRFANILLVIVLAAAAATLPMVVLTRFVEMPPGPIRIFTFVLSLVPTGALAIFILLSRSAFGAVVAIAAAIMVIGTMLGLPALLPPVQTGMYRGDSMGLGRLFGFVVVAALLLWGGATWIGAAFARGASARYVTALKFVAAVPTIVVVVALLAKSTYDSRQPVVALPGVPSTADRPRSPPEEATAGRPVPPPPFTDRGNAKFAAAEFDDTGALLVTAIRAPDDERIQVWNARDGALIATIAASLPHGVDDLAPMLDSSRGRLLLAERNGLVLVDLRTGRGVARLPRGRDGPRGLPLTLIGDGNRALFASNRRSRTGQLDPDSRLELWQLDPPQLLRSERYPVAPISDSIQSWATTADRSVLAIAYDLERTERPYHRLFVIDGATLEARELALPEAHTGTGLHGLAFSADRRLLAVAGHDAIVVHDLASGTWVAASGFDRGSVHDAPRHVYVTADGIPRYVGRADDKVSYRFKQHVTAGLEKEPGALYDWIRDVWRAGYDVAAFTLQEGIIPKDYAMFEQYWIDQFADLLSIVGNRPGKTTSAVGHQIIAALQAQLELSRKGSEQGSD